MLNFKYIIYFIFLLTSLSCTSQVHKTKAINPAEKMTEQDWKKKLTPEQYRILREKGTEYPHTGAYNLHFEKGNYHCSGCDAILFKSAQKFESDCGWPSFDDAVKDAIEYKLDKSHFMIRTEILCKSCGGHLGHLFNDGPTATGERFCVNSVSLKFKKE
jgi:peptide-methionine (R)-S-oxide reductase